MISGHDGQEHTGSATVALVSRFKVGVGALALVELLAFVVGAGAGSPRWRIHDLGTLPAPFSADSEATAINARGVVIGWSRQGADSRAFVWRAGRMRALPSLGGETSAVAIADDGDIVGTGAVPRRSYGHATLWRYGRVIDLGTLGGSLSEALAVNNRGQVVGDSTTATRDKHAFLWQKGTMTDLGTLGGTQSAAVAINTHGDIVGYAQRSPYDPDHAVLWKNGTLHDLGPFGSKVKQAIAINSAGRILVSTFRPDMHAYLWQNGHSTKIWPRYTAARSMNNKGWIVGTALFRRKGPQIPFVWHADTMTALPTLAGPGPAWSGVYAINDRGWIVGRSYNNAGDRAVLWTPG